MGATIENFWIAGRKRSQNQEPVGVKVILSWILLSPTRLTKLNHQRKKKKKKKKHFLWKILWSKDSLAIPHQKSALIKHHLKKNWSNLQTTWIKFLAIFLLSIYWVTNKILIDRFKGGLRVYGMERWGTKASHVNLSTKNKK